MKTANYYNSGICYQFSYKGVLCFLLAGINSVLSRKKLFNQFNIGKYWMGHTVFCTVQTSQICFLKQANNPQILKQHWTLENKVFKNCGFSENLPQNIFPKGVNTECLHVQLLQSLDITNIKMSYSSAAQLEAALFSFCETLDEEVYRRVGRWAKRSPSREVTHAHSLLLALGTLSFRVWERTWSNALPSGDVSVSHLCHVLLVANDYTTFESHWHWFGDEFLYYVSVPCLLGFGSVLSNK